MKNAARGLLTSWLAGDAARMPMRRFFRSRLPIVFYHGVWPKGSRELALFGGIDEQTFDEHLAFFAGRFSFVSLDEMLAISRSGKLPKSPVLTVTFDDGLSVAHCKPSLDRHGARATMFVIEACIGNRHLMWTQKLSAMLATAGPVRFLAAYNSVVPACSPAAAISGLDELPFCLTPVPFRQKDAVMDGIWEALAMPPANSLLHDLQPYMDWPDIAQWMADGHQVGLHTRTHPFCSELDEAGMIEEIVEPAARLRAKLGVDTLSFAYPFGRRLPPALEETAMRQAGLSCMLGTNGLSQIAVPPIAIERAQTEFELGHELYFRPVTSAIKGALGLAGHA